MRDRKHDGTNQSNGPTARFVEVGDWRAELLPQASYDAAYIANTAVIGFAFDRQVGIHAFASDRRTGFQARSNGLAYVPSGCDVYSYSKQGGEYLKIMIPPTQTTAWRGERRFSDVVDTNAVHAAHRLRRLLLAEHPVDPLTVEHLLQTLQDRVAGITENKNPAPRAGMWMTMHRLRRIDELIEARMAEKLTVQDLAVSLGLSTGFFSRAFKAATGKAPHEYVIDRRIARARALLQSNDGGLSAVALAAGFTSHAHMTAIFKSRLGITPSRLRAWGDKIICET